MMRAALIVVTVAALAVPVQAGIFRLTTGTLPDGENPLTVLGDGIFEVSDVPNPAPNDFQYPAISPIDVEVIADDLAGGTMPVVFTLDRVSTRTDAVNVIFSNPTYDELQLQFQVPGLVEGSPIPSMVTDELDGILAWNAPSLEPPSTAPMLAGSFVGGSLVLIPEPSSLFMCGLGMLMLGLRRR